jgi:hypothetical protein
LSSASEGKPSAKDFGVGFNEYTPRLIVGLQDVREGYRPLFLTTVYQVSGDDTSGIAGLLYPDGQFKSSEPPAATQAYWDHTEVPRYAKRADGRVVGNAWFEADVVWEGSVVGSVSPFSAEGLEDESGLRPALHVREWDASLGTEWVTTGELWRALERGTAMTGRSEGRVHEIHSS